MKLKFLNHASYIVENEKTVLLHDPWFQGKAFNDGWSLLSKEIGNQEIIDYLRDSGKSINIWISHEHSDHFNIPFIKSLKASGLDCKFFFQETLDKRVCKFLLANGFKVCECSDGKEYRLDENFSLFIYPYSGGDSFCFLKTNTINILNLNDCIVDDRESVQKVVSKLPEHAPVDILFTQFGYANWIGRAEDVMLRQKSAEEKSKRIIFQEMGLQPRVIIPFASFIYFCKEDNFYLNDEQNFPSDLRKNSALKNIQSKISFMKPNQEVTLTDDYPTILQDKTTEAEQYWDSYKSQLIYSDAALKYDVESTVNEVDLVKLGKSYISSIRVYSKGIIMIFELFRFLGIKPISFHIYDLDLTIGFSYLKGVTINHIKEVDISIHSSELAFILKNEFGWNTLSVSGAFRARRNEIQAVNDFFSWQDTIKNGFSFQRVIFDLFSNKLRS